MLKIAITGGAGSGKSTVARMFQELGAAVIDADAVARSVVAPGQPAWEELKLAFGPEFFQADGSLDRAKMSDLVFSDPEARKRLNKILHPRIIQEMARRLQDLEGRGADLVLVEVPLLFEVGLDPAYDRVMVVYVGPEEQRERLRNRDQREEAEITGILEAQWPLADKRDRADYVVDNRGDLKATRRQVENLWQNLKNLVDKEKQKS
ncbi:MAG: dephospho-CoA kinase [Thermodesulfobacteriota bacterium]